VISGTHKLIGSLTQSAMLHLSHCARAPLDEAAVSRALSLVRTTSPSSLLLGSLDAARARMDDEGVELAGRALAEIGVVKRQIRACGSTFSVTSRSGRTASRPTTRCAWRSTWGPRGSTETPWHEIC
jgi:arginine/lysine/ornithine decarboxylase